MHIHTYIYIYIHIYIHLYIYIYIYIVVVVANPPGSRYGAGVTPNRMENNVWGAAARGEHAQGGTPRERQSAKQ
jgi:hypothetical protein